MADILISCRGDGNAAGYAVNLGLRLRRVFGRRNVVVGPTDGALGSCRVVLAVIGDGWSQARDEQGGLRLDLVDDPQRRALARALADGRHVIPVLVAGSSMPAISDLPAELRGLCRLAAVSLGDRRWDDDAAAFVEALARLPGLLSPWRWMLHCLRRLVSGHGARKPLVIGAPQTP